MAATNPSYYQSGDCQDICQKEHRFLLYMNQRAYNTPNPTEKVVLSFPGGWGDIAVDDFTIRDGPAADANLVGRARGMHVWTGISDGNWLFLHDIMFTDTWFKGSSLQMRGDFKNEDDNQWAVVGGTGEFAYAHGVVNAKVIQPFTPDTGRTWELDIRAFSLCVSELMVPENKTIAGFFALAGATMVTALGVYLRLKKK